MKRYLYAVLVLVLLISASYAEVKGNKKKRALPSEYGNVVINNFSEKYKLAPVVFKHWLHRAKYTCRLCHVDLGFAMEAGGTQIREADNKQGFYCGACHNGKIAFAPSVASSIGEVKNCERCHSLGREVAFEKNFYKFTSDLPTERFGNGINWEKAEREGKIKLTDFLEGVSIRRKPLTVPEDTQYKASVTDMPDILFSHKKHAVWSGCELCHPEIFGVKRGATKYNMNDIFNGKFCGLCHDKVAFPNMDCQRCHSKPVG